jgi:hypothetical protein
MPGDDFPGGRGGFGPSERVWTCSNCNAEVGRGFSRPEHVAKCPSCGVTFGNTAAGHIQQVREDIDGRNNFGNSGFGSPAPAAPPNGVRALGVFVLIIIGIVGLAIMAGTIWFIVWLVQTLSAPSPRRVARRPRPRRGYSL